MISACPPKETLQQLYTEEQRSLQEIGQMYYVTPSTVHFWLKQHDIPRRSDQEGRKIWLARRKPNLPLEKENLDDLDLIFEYWKREIHRSLERSTLQISSTRITDEGTWCMVR